MISVGKLSPRNISGIYAGLAFALLVLACHPASSSEVESTPTASATAALVIEVSPSPTATSAPRTATREPTGTPEPIALPDRTSCEAIQGSDYRSETERQFFLLNCIPTAAPATPTAPVAATRPPAPTATPVSLNVTLRIGGRWLLFDGVGFNFIQFNSAGSVTAFVPEQPNISGQGSVNATNLTFSATGFESVSGETYSVSYSGRRLSASELTGLISLPDIDPEKAIAFLGDYNRSDLPGLPVGVLAIKVLD